MIMNCCIGNRWESKGITYNWQNSFLKGQVRKNKIKIKKGGDQGAMRGTNAKVITKTHTQKTLLNTKIKILK